MASAAPDAAPQRTVSQRFAITLVAQISRSGLSFLTGLVIARGLGPVEYGNVAFLLASFNGLRLMLDLSSSQAFFTLASQRPRSKSFYMYYATWVSAWEIALPFLFIALIFPKHIVDVLWQSQARDRVWLAFSASFFQYLIWPQMIQLGEVVRRTIITQSLTIAISVAQFAIVLLFPLIGGLTVTRFFIVTSLSFLAGVVLAFFLLPHPWRDDVPPESLSAVTSEFLSFCKPLIVSMSLWALTGWVEAWLIQHYVGSVTQGYYAIGTQISLVGLLATTALQNIFWREVAEFEGSGNNERVRQAYVKTSRALMLTALVPVAFLVAWTPQVVHIALGERYHDAAASVALLLVYPVSQTILTLSIIMYSVMRQTRILAIFSSGYAFLYIATSYFLLATSDATVPGLGIGTYGDGFAAMVLGAKLMMFGFLQAFIWEYWIAKRRGWKNEWPHRLGLALVVTACSLIARALGGIVMIWLPPIIAMGSAFIVFMALVGAFSLRWPAYAGIPNKVRDKMITVVKRYQTRLQAGT